MRPEELVGKWVVRTAPYRGDASFMVDPIKIIGVNYKEVKDINGEVVIVHEIMATNRDRWGTCLTLQEIWMDSNWQEAASSPAQSVKPETMLDSSAEAYEQALDHQIIVMVEKLVDQAVKEAVAAERAAIIKRLLERRVQVEALTIPGPCSQGQLWGLDNTILIINRLFRKEKPGGQNSQNEEGS